MRKVLIVSYHLPPDASVGGTTGGIHRELTKVELTRKPAHLLN